MLKIGNKKRSVNQDLEMMMMIITRYLDNIKIWDTNRQDVKGCDVKRQDIKRRVIERQDNKGGDMKRRHMRR